MMSSRNQNSQKGGTAWRKAADRGAADNGVPGLTRRRCLGQLLLALGALVPASRRLAAVDVPLDAASKAASMVLFRDYIKWPAGAAFKCLGILGEDKFDGAVDALKPRRAKELAEVKDCSMLFIAGSEQARMDALLSSLGDATVLTIGEIEGFAKAGGMIGFVADGDRIQFEINPPAVRRAGLQIDVRLLKLAVRVVES